MSQVIGMILNLGVQTNLMSLMEEQHVRVKSESGGKELGHMESTKTKTGEVTNFVPVCYFYKKEMVDVCLK